MSESKESMVVSSPTPNDLKKSVKSLEMISNVANNQHTTSVGISRERSFIRTSNPQSQQNINKRRSLGFQQQQAQHMRKPLEIYRPPKNFSDIRLDNSQNNKLNVHAQEFMMRGLELQNSRSSSQLFNNTNNLNLIQNSKSSGNIHQQIQLAQQNHQIIQHLQQQQQQRMLLQRSAQHPLGLTLHQSSHLPLVNSPSSGNILHQASSPRVKFAPDPIVHASQNYPANSSIIGSSLLQPLPLQRSKSMTSADITLTRGIANLGLGGLGVEDIGTFPPEVMAVISKASEDPNQLTARCLMELTTHCMNRAVEGRRYSLPISRLCISIISKEQKETFLEALMNTCRQWYQEREKVLGTASNSKNPSRPRFTAFMSFLTEMFCQLKRRQLQLRTQWEGISPALVLLTLLGKCCEDCVKPPIRSLSEIECLFFVLTCIGRDLETHLPQQLEILLASVRDAFLNSSASQPAIRRTLLQLIELQASKWQLPCNTVLYYYPSSK